MTADPMREAAYEAGELQRSMHVVPVKAATRIRDEAVAAVDLPPWTCRDAEGRWYRIVHPDHVHLDPGTPLDQWPPLARCLLVSDSAGNPLPAKEAQTMESIVWHRQEPQGHETAQVGDYQLFIMDLGGVFDWSVNRPTPTSRGFCTGGRVHVSGDATDPADRDRGREQARSDVVAMLAEWLSVDEEAS